MAFGFYDRGCSTRPMLPPWNSTAGLIRSCVTLYQRETTSPRQSGLARRRYRVAHLAFQPAKPPILGPNVEDNYARPYETNLPTTRDYLRYSRSSTVRTIAAVSNLYIQHERKNICPIEKFYRIIWVEKQATSGSTSTPHMGASAR